MRFTCSRCSAVLVATKERARLGTDEALGWTMLQLTTRPQRNLVLCPHCTNDVLTVLDTLIDLTAAEQ